MEQREGRVESFDEHAGFGWVAVDGGARHWFHCTQIAGGERTIAVGTPVRFRIQPGHLGRWEAVGVEPRG